MTIATAWEELHLGGHSPFMVCDATALSSCVFSCFLSHNSALTILQFIPSDAQKPAKGVVLTYPGGDGIFCPAGSTRTFSVEVLCSATQGNLVSFGAANVVEANTCDYRAQLKSLAGCPTACITGNTLCSGSGVCGFNTDAKRTQCFCNSGYSGATCGTHSSAPKGLSAEGIILIIVCLVLAGVLGLIGYMYIRLRKLNVDPSAYGDLQGKCA